MLEFIVLGMLLENEHTGYEIKKKIENGIGVFYKASFGSLYPALKKLTGRGLLAAAEKPQGGRQKIFYQMTEEGRRQFIYWLSTPSDILEGANTHLAKIYFFDILPPETRERLLLAYENNSISYLKKLEALENDFRRLENCECFYYKLSTLYYGICITQKTIAWCRHIRTNKPLADLVESGDRDEDQRI